MSEQVILYNHDTDKLVIVPITKQGAAVQLTDDSELSELGLQTTPTAEQVAALITADTFTLSFSDHRAPVSMTYNEWETLRSWQANQKIQEQISALAADEQKKAALSKLFAEFTEGMRIKYLGQKSWTSIYEDLLNNLK